LNYKKSDDIHREGKSGETIKKHIPWFKWLNSKCAEFVEIG